MKLLCTTVSLMLLITACGARGPRAKAPMEEPVNVGSVQQEIATFYTTADGLPSSAVNDVAIASDGTIYAATWEGLAKFSDGKWSVVVRGTPVFHLAVDGTGTVHFLDSGGLRSVSASGQERAGGSTSLPAAVQGVSRVNQIAVSSDGLLLSAETGLFSVDRSGNIKALAEVDGLLGANRAVRGAVSTSRPATAAATASGLLLNKGQGWAVATPKENDKSWKQGEVQAVTLDNRGKLWVAGPDGVACLDGEAWTLYTGADGLPVAQFNTICAGPDGDVWFGTHKGAIHYDGKRWTYRQGQRWLPYDDVLDVEVAPDGSAWFATRKGVGVIRRQAMTLAQKADFFETEIDKYHRRTPYEYVLEVSLDKPGDKSRWTQHDSDNDGLWTAMYGAGECFAYAATKDAKAKERAKKAFEALRFLGEVTQGGTHPAPKGFVARSILPTSGPDPNIEASPERDRNNQQNDPKWKVIVPRWPKSSDGKWYWKTDTSSDELDGHYFFYGLYYDLVADSEQEKERVRSHVRALTDNILDHDYCLADHDGKATRWAVYSPKALNDDPTWSVEKGLNSLSILSYLATTEHITGDAKYRKAADTLIQEHGYAENTLQPKLADRPGTGNQSDDEMAFMGYYNLLKYETNPELIDTYLQSLHTYWMLEEPEANPFFTFVFAAASQGREVPVAEGGKLPATSETLARCVEELKRFPLDRINWAHDNSTRLDIVRISPALGDGDEPKGHRNDGYVVPMDERFFNHYNHDPWQLQSGGQGDELADGTVFLLPYYMALHHKFIVEGR